MPLPLHGVQLGDTVELHIDGKLLKGRVCELALFSNSVFVEVQDPDYKRPLRIYHGYYKVIDRMREEVL